MNYLLVIKIKFIIILKFKIILVIIKKIKGVKMSNITIDEAKCENVDCGIF